MHFTKVEQSLFASFPSDSKFLLNDNQKELIATMFLCKYCCKITTNVKYHKQLVYQRVAKGRQNFVGTA